MGLVWPRNTTNVNSVGERKALTAVLGLGFAVLAVACGSGNTSSELLVAPTEDPIEEPTPADLPPAPGEIAAAASFNAGESVADRTTPAGTAVSLEAMYFEPVVIEGWTAGPECSFDTQVRVSVEPSGISMQSAPLRGPRHDNDFERAGRLGSVLQQVDANGEPTELLAVMVVFDTQKVATLRPPGDDPAQGDAQPVDGWTTLSLALPLPADFAATSVAVELSITDRDQVGTVEIFDLPVVTVAEDGTAPLATLTEAWRFDENQVDQDCEAPAPGPASNQPLPEEVGTNGAILHKKADLPLPPSGEQPANVEQATADVLAAFRSLYDISNLADPAKGDTLTDPDNAEATFDGAIDAVTPFVELLGPRFDSVVFISPTESRVIYRVGPGYSWSLGRALLVEGGWRVAEGTLCRDLADTGFQCPNVVADPGPGPLGH